jgi:serine/threonine-protein kinase
MSNLGTIAPDPATGRAESVGHARYLILRELGRGTTGVVHEAHDVVLGQTVALKTVPIPPVMLPAQRHEFVRRFLDEARIVARLAHPNIVRVHDFGQDRATGTLFIALEHLEGQSLAEVVTASSLPSSGRRPCGSANGSRTRSTIAHLSGIVHRDVKPGNVMLLPRGEPKLFDFGIAKVADAPGHWSIAGQVVGLRSTCRRSRRWASPSTPARTCSPWGAMLYFLITGRRPSPRRRSRTSCCASCTTIPRPAVSS